MHFDAIFRRIALLGAAVALLLLPAACDDGDAAACDLDTGADAGAAAEKFPGACTATDYGVGGGCVTEGVWIFAYTGTSGIDTAVFDSRADGTIDLIFTYAYDTDGRVASLRLDSDADGADDAAYTYTYDDQDGIVSTTTDLGADGTIDETTTYINEYGDAGELIRVTADQYDDGTPDRIELYAYDEAGNVASIREDDRADGVFDSEMTYRYDALGNELFRFDDRDMDGAAERVEACDYSCWG